MSESRYTSQLPQDAGGIEVTRRGSVQILTLKREGFSNRLTRRMAQEAVAALDAARADRSVTGVVLTGWGEVFCTGGDYLGAGDSTVGRLDFGRAFNDFADALVRLGKPTVAAINGDALAGGFAMLAVCDMAVTHDQVRFGLPEAAHGFFPFLATTLVKDSLPKKLFFDIVYRARLLDAQEALDAFLVNEIVARGDVLARAVELAGSTAGYNPDIVSLGRDLYYNTRCTSPHETCEQARFAMVAALKALEESPKAAS